MGFSKELVSVGLKLWGAKAQAEFQNIDYECGHAQEACVDIRQSDLTLKAKRKEAATLPDFDAADLMECGMVNAPRVLQQPEPLMATRRQMRVKRSKDKLQYTLYDENNCALLVAYTCEAENLVKIFAAGEDPKTSQPAFKLTYDSSTEEWELVSHCSDSDAYRLCKSPRLDGHLLMRACHGKEKIGLGLALVMDVDVPEVSYESSFASWSPLRADAEPQPVLTSKRPTWNKKLQSLSMDFEGRVKCASPKNFQLMMGDDLKLVFGKVEPSVFILDFEQPLSAAQSFAIGLTTMFWV